LDLINRTLKILTVSRNIIILFVELPSHVCVNRTSLARRYVTALNGDAEARRERASGGRDPRRDRATRRRADHNARRPTPTTAAMADLVSASLDFYESAIV